MSFSISPGVNISEIDLTTGTTAIATTEGGIAGLFNWGPVGKLTLVDSENTLVAKYGKPTNDNYETFFSAANFLAYANRLQVSRSALVTGFSNTISTTLSSNTTAVISSNTTGLSIGNGVYGSGIPTGTTVSNLSTNSTATIVTLSNAATSTGSQTINFYDSNLAFNAIANSSTAVTRTSYNIPNQDAFEDISIPSGIEFVAKYPGEYGNSLRVSVCTSAEEYSSNINPFAITGYTNSTVIPSTGGLTLEVNSTTANVFISNSATLNFSLTYDAANVMRSSFSEGDLVEVGNTSIGKQTLKIKSIGALSNTNPLSPTGEVYFNLEFESPYTKSTNYASNTISRKWEYSSVVGVAPSTSAYAESKGSTAIDEISIIVVDENGKFSGTSGTILETFVNMSRATDAKKSDSTTNYYKNVINTKSKYIWSVNDLSGASADVAASVINSTRTSPYSKTFIGGTNGSTESNIHFGSLATAMDLFRDTSSVDVALLITGKSVGLNGTQAANYLIDNVAEYRKDCVVFVSPEKSDVTNSSIDRTEAVLEFRSNLRNSSYAFLDSGYKYQYDRYNDVYRYVPLNGDIAGLAARTDNVRDPWWSPAGFNRGQIKNTIKLAWNPNQTEQELLYAADVNPVVTFLSQGTVLFGDKTTLGRTSAFNRINVRRLFIVLEKTIAIAGRDLLFEFNDDFTRSQFKNTVEPFLRDVQSRRGIVAYKVVCDETNNTSDVIDNNRFVGDIYIKPNKSVNFVQLNFVAVGSGVEFTEIIGAF